MRAQCRLTTAETRARNGQQRRLLYAQSSLDPLRVLSTSNLDVEMGEHPRRPTRFMRDGYGPIVSIPSATTTSKYKWC